MGRQAPFIIQGDWQIIISRSQSLIACQPGATFGPKASAKKDHAKWPHPLKSLSLQEMKLV